MYSGYDPRFVPPNTQRNRPPAPSSPFPNQGNFNPPQTKPYGYNNYNNNNGSQSARGSHPTNNMQNIYNKQKQQFGNTECNYTSSGNIYSGVSENQGCNNGIKEGGFTSGKNDIYGTLGNYQNQSHNSNNPMINQFSPNSNNNNNLNSQNLKSNNNPPNSQNYPFQTNNQNNTFPQNTTNNTFQPTNQKNAIQNNNTNNILQPNISSNNIFPTNNPYNAFQPDARNNPGMQNQSQQINQFKQNVQNPQIIQNNQFKQNVQNPQIIQNNQFNQINLNNQNFITQQKNPINNQNQQVNNHLYTPKMEQLQNQPQFRSDIQYNFLNRNNQICNQQNYQPKTARNFYNNPIKNVNQPSQNINNMQNNLNNLNNGNGQFSGDINKMNAQFQNMGINSLNNNINNKFYENITNKNYNNNINYNQINNNYPNNMNNNFNNINNNNNMNFNNNNFNINMNKQQNYLINKENNTQNQQQNVQNNLHKNEFQDINNVDWGTVVETKLLNEKDVKKNNDINQNNINGKNLNNPHEIGTNKNQIGSNINKEGDHSHKQNTESDKGSNKNIVGNLNNEQIRKEFGNVNDPFNTGNEFDTVIQSEVNQNNKQEKNVNDPFNTGNEFDTVIQSEVNQNNKQEKNEINEEIPESLKNPFYTDKKNPFDNELSLREDTVHIQNDNKIKASENKNIQFPQNNPIQLDNMPEIDTVFLGSNKVNINDNINANNEDKNKVKDNNNNEAHNSINKINQKQELFSQAKLVDTTINPFGLYSQNPFDNKLVDSNNNIDKGKISENNLDQNKKEENKQISFFDIPESSTIIQEPKEEIGNNVININNEQNKNEWGNANLDPFGGEKVFDTTLKSDIKPDNNNIKVQDKNQNISNEKKPEQSSENINLENMKDPFADIIENNTVVSESKTENNNNVINVNNEQNKNELGNINSNPFGGEMVSDTIIKSDVIKDDNKENEIADSTKKSVLNENIQEKKPEKSFEKIDLENVQDPFMDIVENNTIISEPKNENNNNLNNNQIKNEWGNVNSNPFGGEIVSDTIIKSDVIQDDEIKVENNSEKAIENNDINKNQSINEKNDNINQVPLTNSNQAENKIEELNNNNFEDKEEKLEFISKIIISNSDENQNNQK